MNHQAPARISTVAILGGGPAASTLATLLARAGTRVAIFHRPRRAALLVGESLVPAIIPMLRTLGVEDVVREFSTFKPGATFNLSASLNFSFFFNQLGGGMPRYAYNVPRDKFDDTLLDNARTAGAKIIEAAAGVERVHGADRVRLTRQTLEAAGNLFSEQPDFIVDATGRVRLLPSLLEIPSHRGSREDAALFAHVDSTTLDYPGHVHTTRIDHGWSWRIPLPGRVSVGMVVGAEHLPKFGASPDERFDNLLRQDSVLCNVAGQAKRLSPVMEYANYQLVSERLTGDGWALVGDSAGFIDPVFSSGLFIGMHSAFELAEAIRKGTPAGFRKYEQRRHSSPEDLARNRGLFLRWTPVHLFPGRPDVARQVPGAAELSAHQQTHGPDFQRRGVEIALQPRTAAVAMKHGMKDEDPTAMAVR